MPEFNLIISEPNMSATFRVDVKTRNKWFAGTDDTVKISISGPVLGETIETGKIKLDEKGVDDHERGDLNHYEFEHDYEFEKIESLTVYKDGSDDWNLDYIKGMVSFKNFNIKN